MKINKDNFFKGTAGRFTAVDIPTRKADHVSYTVYGEISSAYFFEHDGIVRVSDHWGAVASCQWNLEGVNPVGEMNKCRKTNVIAGYISFEMLSKVQNLRNELMQIAANGAIESEEAYTIRQMIKNLL